MYVLDYHVAHKADDELERRSCCTTESILNFHNPAVFSNQTLSYTVPPSLPSSPPSSVTLLDRVMVDYFGSPTPLNQLAGVSVSGPQSLVVSPYDKSAFKLIETAILESNLGLNPNNEGSVLRLNIPPLTEDRRKLLNKQAKSVAEEGKVAVRNVRRDAVERVKKFEKDKAIGKDESQDGQDALQKLTDKFGKQLDEMLKVKEKEIMTV